MAPSRRRGGYRLLLAVPVAGVLVALAAPAHAAPAACPATAAPEAVEAGNATSAEPYAAAEADGSEATSPEGDSWVATEEPVVVDDPAGEPGDSPPSQCEPPGDPGEEEPVVPPEPGGETVAAADVPAVVGAPAAAGPARHVPATRFGPEPRSDEETRPLELPRFVARTILSPLFADGLNPLLAFVLGAAALVAYATLAAGATRRRGVAF